MTTRTALAQRLARDLGPLASDADWSLDPAGDQTEGSYTDAISDGLAAAGVVSLEAATASQVEAVRVAALGSALTRLEFWWAAQVDLKVGQRDEKLSQISKALRTLRAAQRAEQEPQTGTSFTTGWVRDDGYGERP